MREMAALNRFIFSKKSVRKVLTLVYSFVKTDVDKRQMVCFSEANNDIDSMQ